MQSGERAVTRRGAAARLVDQPGRAMGIACARIVATLALVAAGAVMLSWVTLFNGAPLVFPDSITYAISALRREVPGVFSAWYGILILPLHQGITLWPVILAQGAMLGHLLYLVVRCVSHGIIGRVETLTIIACLSLFSSLPWITGELLPDVFSPVVLLGIFLLAFCTGQLGRGELVYVALLTTVAIAVHLSHVPIAFALLLLALAVQWRISPDEITVRRWLVLGVVFAFGAGAMLAVNWSHSRTLAFARNSNVFLLAKLIGDGPGLAYLDQACPTTTYDLCAYLDDMRGRSEEDLKWDDQNSPFRKVGGFDRLEPEAREIVKATLRAYPLEILQRAIRDAGRQLLRFQAGESLTDYHARFVAYHLGSVFASGAVASIAQSRQAMDQLSAAAFHPFHVVGLIVGTALCLWSLIIWRKTQPAELIALQVFVILGILCNAVVTGALSGPYDRYLARVIWLIPFAGLVGLAYAHALRRRRRAGAAAAETTTSASQRS
ncbi:hypothetical protein [Bradyrhizobium sp. LHD-71]|uniref:hypothetical protein n=1 Tax=Bradyrhizobium sp. LHD-71 TaxID=3072141 RepID=UPI00280F9EE4|nr:hypothetical protein [Bradyrhizobium sp. LHD-71]MDQ8727969.1 hypothetical protein [Bradyrhizobium sp. LHD-71]